MARRARRARLAFREYEETGAQRSSPDPDRIAVREEAEAANLVANVLDKNPDARVFVYCGFSHAAKRPIASNTWMAARLMRKTGIDPLCIDQTEGLPYYDRAREPAELSAVLSRFAPDKPIVVRTAAGAPHALGDFNGAVDLAVVHPRLPRVDGRPGWLASAPRRRLEIELPAPLGGQALLQAVPSAEASMAPNVVPADQMLIDPGARSGVLFVRPGRYDLRLETLDGVMPLGRRSAA
jgi:hypothetical protein